jgi:hypothetical protein
MRGESARRIAGTLLSRIPEMNQECPRWIVSSGTGSERAEVASYA